jgi:hypothetical protein
MAVQTLNRSDTEEELHTKRMLRDRVKSIQKKKMEQWSLGENLQMAVLRPEELTGERLEAAIRNLVRESAILSEKKAQEAVFITRESLEKI